VAICATVLKNHRIYKGMERSVPGPFSTFGIFDLNVERAPGGSWPLGAPNPNRVVGANCHAIFPVVFNLAIPRQRGRRSEQRALIHKGRRLEPSLLPHLRVTR
jgi:hypothetical protein